MDLDNSLLLLYNTTKTLIFQAFRGFGAVPKEKPPHPLRSETVVSHYIEETPPGRLNSLL